MNTEQITTLVKTERAAAELIASLLEKFATQAATERLVDEARFQKQTARECARRVASNLLTGFRMRKTSWF